MSKRDERNSATVPSSETAAIELRFGQHRSVRISASMTPAGLLAIGGMVSGMLLSTAVIVRAARRQRHEPPMLRLPHQPGD